MNGLTPEAVLHGLAGVVMVVAVIETGVAFLMRGGREAGLPEDGQR